LGMGHSLMMWPEWPQLEQVWPEVVPTVDGTGKHGTGGGAVGVWEVGGKPTAATGAGAAGASAATADEAGRLGLGGTPSGTWEEHCRTELPQPSSSLLPCGCGLPHL
jgi:hypothetical protein